jgi:hypothetical protein
MGGGGWTSLEIVKVGVAAATPLIVLLGGFWLNGRLKKLEHAQWSTQKVIERRISAYDQIAGTANDLYCYFCYVGYWKELKPSDVIELKRKLDKAVYTNVPLFEPKFKELYDELMKILFEMFGDWGSDAKLRTHIGRRKRVAGENWVLDWDGCFVDEQFASTPEDVKLPYGRFMAYLAESVGVSKVDEQLLGTGETPGNFDVRAAEIGTISGAPVPDADGKWS